MPWGALRDPKAIDTPTSWSTPRAAHPRAIPVIGQCKTTQRPLSPGSLHGFAAVVDAHAREHGPALGIMVSERGFTAGTIKWATRVAATPLVLVTLPPVREPWREMDEDDADEFDPTRLSMCVANPLSRQLWPWLDVDEFRARNGERWYRLRVDGGCQGEQ
ncbi:hypothetical protein H9P43_005998 [Blastocladiella emersonii ATCC 22665]|nr:hypothetical protein H9P43_005998 [Blastocladiella emersonii ATCC 22665]